LAVFFGGLINVQQQQRSSSSFGIVLEVNEFFLLKTVKILSLSTTFTLSHMCEATTTPIRRAEQNSVLSYRPLSSISFGRFIDTAQIKCKIERESFEQTQARARERTRGLKRFTTTTISLNDIGCVCKFECHDFRAIFSNVTRGFLLRDDGTKSSRLDDDD
jgi:hypothetical protein